MKELFEKVNFDQKNRLIETVLLGTNNVSFDGDLRKNNFQLHTLNWRPVKKDKRFD